jgi:hypothetical protein
LLKGVCCGALAVGGCSSEDKPQPPPASQPAADVPTAPPVQPPKPEPEPELNPLLPESETWSCEEALAKLADEAASVSAAVRLVRLAEAAPLCLPDPLPPKLARRLRVLALSESLWALGLGTSDESHLRSPVLIDMDGDVTLPVEGIEEELALLCRAEDAELFPHLLITPERVLMVGEELQSALVTKLPAGLSFALRCEDDYPYVVLLWRAPLEASDDGGKADDQQPAEVARYTYDAYEFAFMGPLSDKLPDPPGGLFELDLEQSAALVPVGGVIPEPPKIERPKFEPVEGEPTPY